MKLLGRIFLNYPKLRKDVVFLWDVEEITFLINKYLLLHFQLSDPFNSGELGY